MWNPVIQQEMWNPMYCVTVITQDDFAHQNFVGRLRNSKVEGTATCRSVMAARSCESRRTHLTYKWSPMAWRGGFTERGFGGATLVATESAPWRSWHRCDSSCWWMPSSCWSYQTDRKPSQWYWLILLRISFWFVICGGCFLLTKRPGQTE